MCFAKYVVDTLHVIFVKLISIQVIFILLLQKYLNLIIFLYNLILITAFVLYHGMTLIVHKSSLVLHFGVKGKWIKSAFIFIL